MKTQAVRGAVSLAEDSPQELRRELFVLYQEILEQNGIKADDIISLHFSQTPDVSYNPAKALREEAGLGAIPLFCSLEPPCVDLPPLRRVIRLLIYYNAPSWGAPPHPVYRGLAQQLRKDLENQ